MSQNLTVAVEELRREEVRLQADLEKHRQQARDCEIQLKQIQKALSALNERPRRRPASDRPPVRKEEAVNAMSDILRERGPLQESELKRLVCEELVKAGRSRVGLALRFKEAFKDSHFIRNVDGMISIQAIPNEVTEHDKSIERTG